MFGIFKTIRESAEMVSLLNDKLNNLSDRNDRLEKIIGDRTVYDAIGFPFTEKPDKRIQLFMEARKRGFFDDNCYFSSMSGGWESTAYFKHHYSSIAYNYGYYEDDDTLRIPVIGVKGNISAGRICIYKNGEWAKIICINKQAEV